MSKPADNQHEAAKSLGLPEEKALFTTGIIMRLIPAGTFVMGSAENETGRNPDERQHTVTLTEAFYLGKYAVTQAQWKKVMGNNPSNFNNAGDDAPVQNVSWFDCKEFTKTLASLEQLAESTVRLPTEAEWEYACRAGSHTPFCYGEDLDSSMANFDGRWPYGGGKGGTCRGTTMAVGQFRPNEWGLYDMHGNVWEWCEDWYADYGGDAADPSGPSWGSYRVIRGGAWDEHAGRCRSAVRDYRDSGNTGYGCGFRLFMRAGRNKAAAHSAGSEPVRRATTPVIESAPRTNVPQNVPGNPNEKVLPATGIVVRMISPGTFVMGSPESEPGRNPDETQHTVTLTRAFLLGKYQVTQAQWIHVMGKNPAMFKNSNLDNAPVENVSWDDCRAFMKKVAELEGMPESLFRFPTEAEWEYACRAGTQTPFCYGGDLDSTMANFDGKVPYGNGKEGEARKKTISVGQFAPNAWGLYDMHGNVCEWCEDWHGEYAGDATNPQGPDEGKRRVIRGGSWCFHAARCRSAYRDSFPQGGTNLATGFRLCMTE